MRNIFLTAVALATLSTGVTPVTAQAVDRVLTIYGNDKCPTNASGEEIVVCARRPEGERFRIPKELRADAEIAPGNQSWAARANDTLDANASSGIGSCSASGSQGWTGCWTRQMRAAKAEKRAQAERERNER